MIECYHCGSIFKVQYEDTWESQEVSYCPNCGTELDVELDFNDE